MKKFEFSFLCDNNPEKMPDNGSTRYCKECDRNILDLTKLTPAQIVETTKSGKKLCGFMFPWQEKQINAYIAQQEKPTIRPMQKMLRVAAIAGSPLLATTGFSQKTEVKTEQTQQKNENSSIKPFHEFKFLNKDGLPLIGFAVEIKTGSLTLNLATDTDGKINVNPLQIANSEIIITIHEIGFTTSIQVKSDVVCRIITTSTNIQKAELKPEKIDLQFLMRNNDKERPILFRKVKIELYDTSNNMIELIETNTNMGGYSLLKSSKLEQADHIMFTIYTHKGRRTAYLNMTEIKNKEVNVITVNKKFRRYHGGVYFYVTFALLLAGLC